LSKDWYLPSKPQIKTSGFERDEFLDYAEDYFIENLETTFLGEPVVLYQDGTLDESTAIHTKANVWGSTPVRDTQFMIRHLITRRGQSKHGNYVKYQDKIWLITEPPGDNQIYEHAWIQLCNYAIKYINHNGEIVEYPCWFGDETRFSPGEKETRYLVIPNVHLLMLLPKNEDTLRLKRGNRFIIDDPDRVKHDVPMVYQITKTNPTERSNRSESIFKYSILESPYNPATDNAELMIADYYNNKKNYSLDIITPESVEIQQGRTFSIQLDTRINNKPVTEAVELESENVDIASVESSGVITAVGLGETRINILFGYIEKAINVKVVPAKSRFQDTANISFAGSPTIRAGSTKVFIAVFFDKEGNEMNDTAMWSIDDMPSFLTMQIQDSQTMVLRCGSGVSYIGSKFTLSLNGKGLSSDSIEITVVGLT